jgi:hypothetical protein
VSFKDAVESTPHLENCWQPGLQALRAEDRPHIAPQNTRNLRGSVDVDTAWRRLEPKANRWDFAIAYQHTDRQEEFVYWVETHTASNSQANKVILKAQWLLNWLRNAGRNLNAFERDIVWVSSGATKFTLTAPQKNRMAAAGLRNCGGRLRITDACGD